MNYTDKKLVCLDCGQEFIFTEGEQRFFWSKSMTEPKRCKQCRMIRRQSIVNVKKEDSHNDNTKSAQFTASNTL